MGEVLASKLEGPGFGSQDPYQKPGPAARLLLQPKGWVIDGSLGLPGLLSLGGLCAQQDLVSVSNREQ